MKGFTTRDLQNLGFDTSGKVAVKLPLTADPIKPIKRPRAQIRVSTKRTPNATELEWMEMECPFRWPEQTRIELGSLTFRLNNGTLYSPDTVVWCGNAILAVCEVKGDWIHNRNSTEKFKSALAENTHLCWVFAQKRKELGWCVEVFNQPVL